MSAPLVSLLKQDNYQTDAILKAIRDLLAPLGGMEAFVKPGASVLLKPNLVFGRRPEKAINTHPEIVRAVATLVREAGAARIDIGDSPGYGSARSAAKNAGILAVAEEMDLEVVEFTPKTVEMDENSVARLELAAEAFETDVIINLPKMKTHGQMLMSLAVKNMFGLVPGARKLQWHYRAGRDVEYFARILNAIAQTVRPHLSILDAVEGMDGLGPTAGRARPVGFLAAGADPWAIDATVMDILGLDHQSLPILRATAESGPADWREREVIGPAPAELRPADWRIPELRTLNMHGGFVDQHLPWLAEWLRARISPRPVANSKCVACGHCADICPAKAISIVDNAVVIDGEECIRCYCCHELCQYGGMDIHSGGWLAKLLIR